MMAQTGNRIDAVLAGSGALADGAIAVLPNQGLTGKVPVVGRAPLSPACATSSPGTSASPST